MSIIIKQGNGEYRRETEREREKRASSLVRTKDFGVFGLRVERGSKSKQKNPETEHNKMENLEIFVYFRDEHLRKFSNQKYSKVFDDLNSYMMPAHMGENF